MLSAELLRQGLSGPVPLTKRDSSDNETHIHLLFCKSIQNTPDKSIVVLRAASLCLLNNRAVRLRTNTNAIINIGTKKSSL